MALIVRRILIAAANFLGARDKLDMYVPFGKIGLLGPLPLAQSAVRSMDITARAT